MATMDGDSALAAAVKEFVLRGFQPHSGQLVGERAEKFGSRPLWKKMRELGTELWIDTGSLGEAGELWDAEFTALTTNNTLLNREVQTGAYDGLIVEARALLDGFDLSSPI